MKFPLGVKGLLLVLFFYINSSFAQTIYVDANAGGLNNGASWKNAYIDLQTALQLAVSGNDIWVKGGVYKPTSSNKRVTSFVMKEGVSLYGGFSGIETDINQRDRSTQTVLSGDIGNLSDSTDN